jgi:hypothetical protein
MDKLKELIASLRERAAALEAKARTAAEQGITVAEADVIRVCDLLETELDKLEAKLKGPAQA